MTLRALVGLSIAALAATGTALAAGLEGSEAPDFVLPSAEGKNIRLSEHRGEIVMLAFWASWCGACRPELERAAETYERYRDTGVVLLAVNLDRDAKDASEAARAMHADYPVLHDAGGEVGRAYGVDSMPALVLIDRDGIVRDVIEGNRRGRDDDYVEKLRDLLREL
ncbi:MAG TPA: TlpA disulfide reductase family protein [Gammaproteobacteria bacterium]|nr:TlpA disulfide reductase family protein [Gammaproteobacteria bacterium]